MTMYPCSFIFAKLVPWLLWPSSAIEVGLKSAGLLASMIQEAVLIDFEQTVVPDFRSIQIVYQVNNIKRPLEFLIITLGILLKELELALAFGFAY